MRNLVLWDIDLTLVDYPGTGHRWYREALANLFGVAIRHVPEWPGRTERALTTELLTAHGLATDEESVQRVFVELVRVVGHARPDLPTIGRALPGAADVLAALHGQDGVVQSLVTGNLRELAGYKLEPFGLDAYVDFEVGGYGSISEHRQDLVSSAMALTAAKYGAEVSPGSVVVIGDTPYDVRSALHHGAVGIGVATGRHSMGELRACGAHAVLGGLSDTQAVLNALHSAWG
jgi:phosphoglycolate phosphatase-like HAD superfamily hydrolase